MRRWIVAAILSSLSSCRFEEALPAGSRVPCGADRECPRGSQCDEQLALCVAAISPFIVTSPLRPDRGRAGDVFRLTLATAELAPESLVVVALDRSSKEIGVFSFESTNGSWSWTATGAEPEGPMRVFASTTARARLSAVNLVALGRFELDFTPPRAITRSLRVLPEATNPLVTNGFPSLVSAARSGSSVEATFEMSEPVQGLPEATFSTRDAGFPLTTSSPGAGFRAVGVVPEQSPEGTWEALVQVADTVGNRATIGLGTLEVRNTPPPPLAIDVVGRIVYHRAPWGTLEEAQPRYTLTGGPAAAPGAAVVVVSAGPYLIGSAAVAGDGSFEVPLTLEADVPSVQIRSIDSAGNVSPRMSVLDVEWTISALAADAGALREFGAFEAFSSTASRSATVVPGTPWATTGSFQLAGPNRSEATWLAQTRSGVVGNGSVSNAGRFLVTRNFNFEIEQCRNAAKTPGYDLERDRWYCTGRGTLVPMGDGGTVTDDRIGARAVWVPPEHRLMVLGGTVNEEPRSGGFWFDGVYQGSIEPEVPARVGHAMQWDPARLQVVIFGGRGSDGGLLNDTWVWIDGGFSELTGAGPSPRFGAALAWDEPGRRLVLAGGVLQDGSLASDTWVHDGRTWWPVDAGPYPGRLNGSFSASADPSILLMLGGTALDGGTPRQPDGGPIGATALNEGHWAPLPTGLKWSFGERPTLGYHPQWGVVAIGGAFTDEVCLGEYCDYFSRMEPTGMWAWRDWGWVALSDGGVPSVVDGRLGFSQSSGELVLHQGFTFAGPGSALEATLFEQDWRQQYRWSQDAGWSVRNLADAGAPPVTQSLTCFDEASDRLLVHGGRFADGGFSAETWEQRSDGTWGLLEIGPPLVRPGSRWVAGRDRNTSLVASSESGTWSFNGQWVAASRAPSVMLATHPVSGRFLALSPTHVSSWFAGAWVAEPLSQIPDLTGTGLQADPQKGQIIAVGASANLGNTVVLDYAAGQAVQVFSVPLARATPASVSLVAVTFRTRTGGRGEDVDGGPVEGAQLLIRLDGKLTAVGQPCRGGVATASECSFTVTDPKLINRWLKRGTGYQPDVEVGLSSRGRTGRGTPAQLSTSALEFSLTYRRDGGSL